MADDDPQRMPCWPQEWLDGSTEVEITTRHLRAHWDADILDLDDKNKHDTIIERKDAFEVRFRVELEGRAWRCMCGHWCFDLGFTSIGKGPDFDLSDYLPEPEKSKLRVCNWKGCDTRCIEVCVRVPPECIPVEHCGSLYDVGAKFELWCCGECDGECSGHLALAGHEPQGEYMFV